MDHFLSGEIIIFCYSERNSTTMLHSENFLWSGRSCCTKYNTTGTSYFEKDVGNTISFSKCYSIVEKARKIFPTSWRYSFHQSAPSLQVPLFLLQYFAFRYLTAKYRTILNDRSFRLSASQKTCIVWLELKGSLKSWPDLFPFSFFFSFFQHETPLVLTLERSREAREVTWEWQQMRRGMKLQSVAALCRRVVLFWRNCCDRHFNARFSRCFPPLPAISLALWSPPPFGVGRTLLRCQVPVFWEKGLRRSGRSVNPI